VGDAHPIGFSHYDTEDVMSDARSWIDRLGRRLERWRARGLGDTWVVAVSGGGDSVGLLRVLHRLAPALGLRLSVAHLDHGVRGEAAREDAAFVAELAASLGLPFDLGRWQPRRAGHFESDARRARYDWLADVARSRGAGVVAVGHTRDDQAETILHRILRGTGPRGLAGIPTRRRLAANPEIQLVRPLLDVSRRAIRDFLQGLGQPYREDASNADLARTRARIRHDLLPRLAAEYNSDVARALVRLGALAAASHRAIAPALRELEHASVVAVSPDRVVLDGGVLAKVPRFLRAEVVRRSWRRAGWPERGMSARRWRRLAALARGGEARGVAVGAGVSASIEGSSLVLCRSTVAGTGPVESFVIDPIPLDVPGAAAVPWAGGRVVAEPDPRRPCDEAIDRDRLDPPLAVRAPSPEDRFAPLGMGGKSTPLADFLRGRGVPRDRRAHTPLVCDRVGIVWVVGHRIAERVKVTDQTRRTLGMSWSEPS
jgi:tRNA(Ile)-lysidine synthase